MAKLRLLLATILLAGCVSAPPPARAPLPAPLLPTLGERWTTPQGGIIWPPAEGFAAAPSPMILPAGLLIDRFGSPYGRFFSPKGADFAARALPYDCSKLAYTTYRVMTPIFVWVGKAAPWFDQAGGATQFETDATAAQLVGDAALQPVAAPGPSPCKTR